MSEERLLLLIERFLDGRLSEEEAKELDAALDSSKKLLAQMHDEVTLATLLERHHTATPDLADRIVRALRNIDEKDRLTKKIMGELPERESVPLPFRIPRLVWISAAACLAVVLAAVSYTLFRAGHVSPERYAEILSCEKNVSIERNGESPAQAAQGMTLRAGDSLRTIATGAGTTSAPESAVAPFHAVATLRYTGEPSEVSLAENSRVTLSDAGGAKRLTLNQGHLQATIAPQPADRPLQISTPNAQMEILGTRLAVEIVPDPDETSGSHVTTRLEVMEGRVRLTRLSGNRETVEVSGGHYAVVSANTPIVPKALAVTSGAPEKNTEGNIILQSNIPEPWDMAFDGKDLWISHGAGQPVLSRVNPRDGRLLGTLDLTGVVDNPSAIAWDGQKLWISDPVKGVLFRINPKEGKVEKLKAVEKFRPADLEIDPVSATLFAAFLGADGTVYIAKSALDAASPAYPAPGLLEKPDVPPARSVKIAIAANSLWCNVKRDKPGMLYRFDMAGVPEGAYRLEITPAGEKPPRPPDTRFGDFSFQTIDGSPIAVLAAGGRDGLWLITAKREIFYVETAKP